MPRIGHVRLCGKIAPYAVLTIAAWDRHVQQLLDTVRRLAAAFDAAGIEYRCSRR